VASLHHIFGRTAKAGQTQRGADWEWWFLGPDKNLRVLVQAKKLYMASETYKALDHANTHGRQVDPLIGEASRRNAWPFYCFYNGKGSHLARQPASRLVLQTPTLPGNLRMHH